ncbi:MAG: Rieske (2Fe-2S) protein [Rubripirellula sp.]|jgi:nitrite reductase (NADH) small subunit/3-phenylpropionate/trans-cinnamate dioxygenase ferredoxin subunit|nr:Rieske (2Fe-2S) protein [Rubripirellula sp.]
MSEFQIVCITTDIPVGESKCFEVNGQMVGVYHLPDGFYAIDDPCPHAGASLVRGCIEGEIVRCRIHYWGFGIKDGLCVDQEIPQHNAKTYKVRITGDQVAVCTAPS